jgi:hypothetical protein
MVHLPVSAPNTMVADPHKSASTDSHGIFGRRDVSKIHRCAHICPRTANLAPIPSPALEISFSRLTRGHTRLRQRALPQQSAAAIESTAASRGELPWHNRWVSSTVDHQNLEKSHAPVIIQVPEHPCKKHRALRSPTRHEVSIHRLRSSSRGSIMAAGLFAYSCVTESSPAAFPVSGHLRGRKPPATPSTGTRAQLPI